MKRRAIAWLLLLSPFATSCGDGGIKTGNGLDVTVEAVSTYEAAPAAAAKAAGVRGEAAPSLPAPDAHEPPTVFNFEGIRVHVLQIEFQLPSGTNCGDYADYPFAPPVSCIGTQVQVEGPLVADLVTGETVPALSEFNIPSGTYRRVDLRIKPADEGTPEPGDPLEGNSIHAAGNFEFALEPKTFEFALAFVDNIKFEDDDGIQITADEFEHVLLDMDVAQWFSSLPITQCIIDEELVFDENDRLVIEDASEPSSPCKNIENELKQAIKDSGKLNEQP
ncbi:MAG: hypothetical protein AB1405_02265 [Bdellovibrionota bacterium]